MGLGGRLLPLPLLLVLVLVSAPAAALAPSRSPSWSPLAAPPPPVSPFPTASPGASSWGTIVPLYWYPPWPEVVAALNGASPLVSTIFIVNPNSGPGFAQDATYASSIASLRAARPSAVIGYIDTDYVLIANTTVVQAMQNYSNFYPGLIDGFFFDRVTSQTGYGYESYYGGLISYAMSMGYSVFVGNPGTEVPSTYYALGFSALVVYENAGLTTSSATGGYPLRQRAMLSYNNAALNTTWLTTIAKPFCSWIYVTNNTVPNPFSGIPPYFSSLLSQLALTSSPTQSPLAAPPPPISEAPSLSPISLTPTASPVATTWGTIVPLYWYPPWSDVVAALNGASPLVSTVFIINPNSGPGTSRDVNYASSLVSLRAARPSAVIGYVNTDYGTAPNTTVAQAIFNYTNFYPGLLDGIFFDKVASLTGHEAYYTDLTSYARSLGFSVLVGDPGTEPASSTYYSVGLDTLVIYENLGVPNTLAVGINPLKQRALISYNNSALNSTWLTSVAKPSCSWIYVTNGTQPNPYANLSPFFSSLLSLLGQTATPSAAPTGSAPSVSPVTASPSQSPSSLRPSASPTSARPSTSPSRSPYSMQPSKSPTSNRPSFSPSRSPRSMSPTHSPSKSPISTTPSASPSRSPNSARPSKSPASETPSKSPISYQPSRSPSASPSMSQPSRSPSTFSPTRSPSRSPSKSPGLLLHSTSPTSSAPSVSPTARTPQVRNATFSPSFTSVLVTFDSITNAAQLDLGHVVPCAGIASTSDVCSQCPTNCYFADLQTLVILLSADSRLAVGDNVTIAPGLIFSYFATHSSTPVSGRVSIALPLGVSLPIPALQIIGPSAIGSCSPPASLSLIASGTGGRPMAVNWTSSLGAKWQNVQTIPVAYNGTSENETFTVHAVNWLGQQATSPAFTVFKSALAVLDVQLSSPSTLSVNSSTSLSVSALVSLPSACNVSGAQFSYQWSLSAMPGFIDVSSTFLSLLTSPTTSADSLAPGSYLLKVVVTGNGFTANDHNPVSIQGSASATINVAVSPVVLKLNTGSTASIVQGQTFIVSANRSCDPNVQVPPCTPLGIISTSSTAQLSYFWTCVDKNQSPCVLSNCLGCLSAPFIDTSGLNSSLSPYTISATVASLSTPSAPQSSSRVLLSVLAPVSTCSPLVVLLGAFPARINVQGDPNAQLALQGSVSAQGNVSFAWSTVGGSTGAGGVGLLLAPGSVLSGRNLILAPSRLTPGVSYTLQLTATQGCGQTGSAAVTFEANSPPVGGALSVNPSVGTAAATLFTLTASLFEDPEGDLPLQYAFQTASSDDNTYSWLSSFSLSPLLSTLLGASSAGNQTVFAVARDSLGATSGQLISAPVEVLSAASASFNASAILNQVAAQGGSPDDTVRTITALASAATLPALGSNSSALAWSAQTQDVLLASLVAVVSASSIVLPDPSTSALQVSAFLAVVQGATVPSQNFIDTAGKLALQLVSSARASVNAQTLGSQDPQAQTLVPGSLGNLILGSLQNLIVGLKQAVGANATNSSQSSSSGRRLDVSEGPDPALVRSTLESLAQLVITGAVHGTPVVVIPGETVQVAVLRQSTSQAVAAPPAKLVISPYNSLSTVPATFTIPPNVYPALQYSGDVSVLCVRFGINIDEILHPGQVNYTKDPLAPAETINEFYVVDFLLDNGTLLHPSGLDPPIVVTLPLDWDQIPRNNQSSSTAKNKTLSCGSWDVAYGGWTSSGCNVTDFSLPRSATDHNGSITLAYTHASDYAAWQAFENEVNDVFHATSFSLITTASLFIVVILLPGSLLLWGCLMCWGRNRDLSQAHLVHLGTFTLLTANKIRLDQKARRFFQALRTYEKSTKPLPMDYYRPKKAIARWRNPALVYLRAIWYESSLFGLANRFDPYFERMQRASIMLGILVGNLFIACFFYQLQIASDVSTEFLIGRIVLGSLVVLIPLKFFVRVLFVLAVAREGSTMDRVVHIFRVLAFTDDVMPSGRTEAARADVKLLHALKNLYARQRLVSKLRKAKLDLVDGKGLQQPIVLARRSMQHLSNPVFELERGLAKTAGVKRRSRASLNVGKDNIQYQLEEAEERLQDAKDAFRECLIDSRRAWKKTPRASFRTERTRRQRSALFKVAAVLAEPDEPHLRPMERGNWRLPHPFVWVAWFMLVAYYLLCIVYTAFWVLTRADTVENLVNDTANGTLSQQDFESATRLETDQILFIWLTSAGFAILFTYFVTEPILIAIRFVLLPACLRRWGARIQQHLEDLGKSSALGNANRGDKSFNVSAALHIVAHDAAAVAATAHEQTRWERSLIFVFDFVSEVINTVVP